MLKTMLFTLCLLGGTVAFGQTVLGTAGMSFQPAPLQFQSNPQRAAHKPMGKVEDLLDPSENVRARGILPLWELAPVKQEVPLGDTARLLRKEHASQKKAHFVVTD